MIDSKQQSLFEMQNGKFPSTRYQGSKQKFIEWIWLCLKDVKFTTCLDAFGGTGCFAFKAKQERKSVTYNDLLPFNAIIGKALVENQGTKLTESDVEYLLDIEALRGAPTFIEDTFHDVYYTDEENRWLDRVSYKIRKMEDEYKKAMAYFALFQSCIIKRPYNLFHRKNLYVRMQDVERSFGNKKTWDTPFPVHFKKFVNEVNAASFNSGVKCSSQCGDALSVEGDFDLVYIDTPYVGANGKCVDYADFYHFLDGIAQYDNWAKMIDEGSLHKRLKRVDNPWCDKNRITNEFEKLFSHFSKSALAISYRSDGIPSVEQLVEMLRGLYRTVKVSESWEIKYALSKSKSKEVLLLATNL